MPNQDKALAAQALPFESVDDAFNKFRAAGYASDRDLATIVFLAGHLGKPLLLEGPAGVGKTELAKTIAKVTDRPLIRLQCYEGLDESRALYEWEYGKQLVYIQLLRDSASSVQFANANVAEKVASIDSIASELFSEKFLVRRPLFEAIQSSDPVVLLIDEIDRADPEFEAMLLELLSDFQVSIPEIGTIKAKSMPFVVLTSNASRELGEALRRRCLFAFMGYPSPARELEILSMQVPAAQESLRQQIIMLAHQLRAMDLQKPPSVAEVVEWARALVVLGAQALDKETLDATLPVLLKHQEDIEQARNQTKI